RAVHGKFHIPRPRQSDPFGHQALQTPEQRCPKMSIPRKRGVSFLFDLLIIFGVVSALSSCKPDAPATAAATPAGPATRAAAVPAPPVAKEKEKKDLAI